MIAFLSSLMGIFGGSVPTVLKIFNARQEHQREIELMRLSMEMQQQAGAFRLEESMHTAQSEALSSAFRHDAAIGKGASQLVVNIRALVRPALSLVVIGSSVFFINKIVNLQPETVPLAVVADFVFASANSVLWFWFTNRAVSKNFGEK